MAAGRSAISRRPLLIGQAPPPSYDPANHSPLYPFPETSTGGRLVELMGLDPRDYLRLFQRINLLRDFPGRRQHPCGTRRDHWPRREARVAADTMMPLLGGRHVVLLGRNVARAFGLEQAPFFIWTHMQCRYPPDAPVTFGAVVAPHPSGLNRWYSDRLRRRRAEAFWKALAYTAKREEEHWRSEDPRSVSSR